MTKREAAIVSAYTGFLIGSFSDMHEYIEEVMMRPVFTHEMGTGRVADEIKIVSKSDYIALSERLT